MEGYLGGGMGRERKEKKKEKKTYLLKVLSALVQVEFSPPLPAMVFFLLSFFFQLTPIGF